MKTMTALRFTPREMALAGAFAGVMAVFSQISIPLMPVPLSLGLFGALLCALVLDTKLAVAVQGVYLLLGAAGAPVFAGFQGGIQRLAGPTGGYLVSYILIALAAGTVRNALKPGFWGMLLAAVCGVAICYACGALWLGFSMKLGVWQTILSGIVPFVPLDLVKAVAAAFLGGQLRAALRNARL